MLKGSSRSLIHTSLAFASVAGLMGFSALPAYGMDAPDYMKVSPISIHDGSQSLKVGDYDIPEVTRDLPEVGISEEWLREQAAKNHPHVYRNVPSGVGAQGLVAAALAQLGVPQDCTDLVQNSLAAIGLTARRDQGGFDLGTGIWQYDRFGVRVDINSLNPGDILIYGNAGSGTHVAIYVGDGMAVHGGYGNNTVVAGVHTASDRLTGAIRVTG